MKRKEEGEGRQVATRRAYRTYERRLHSSKHQEVVHLLREREKHGREIAQVGGRLTWMADATSMTERHGT